VSQILNQYDCGQAPRLREGGAGLALAQDSTRPHNQESSHSTRRHGTCRAGRARYRGRYSTQCSSTSTRHWDVRASTPSSIATWSFVSTVTFVHGQPLTPPFPELEVPATAALVWWRPGACLCGEDPPQLSDVLMSRALCILIIIIIMGQFISAFAPFRDISLFLSFNRLHGTFVQEALRRGTYALSHESFRAIISMLSA
jgi:hypothetical protein